MNDDLYQALGVDREASAADIKAAYRRLVRTHHPDAGGDPDEFVRITTAYNVLEDVETRKAYDLSGEYGDENPLEAQMRVIHHIASMFERILTDLERPPEEFDIVAAMNGHTEKLRHEFDAEERRLGKILAGLHKTNQLIKKKGEGRNIFSEIAEKRILEVSEEYKLLKMQIRDVRRVAEELNRYKSVVDVVRTVQAGAYPGRGRSGLWTVFNPLTST